MERQYGSSEKTRTQGRREKGRREKERCRTQRIGTQGRAHARTEQGGEGGGAEEAQVARFGQNQTEKPASSPAFLLP